MSIAQELPSSAPATHAGAADMSDEELLLAYRKTGDQDSFSELVRRYEGPLYAYLRRRFRDESLAEDAVQTAFLQAHVNCEKFESGRSVRPWLYAIATNAGIDTLRKKRHGSPLSLHGSFGGAGTDAAPLLETLANAEPTPTDRLSRRERDAECRQAVAQLPERLRVVIELFYFRQFKYREAAEALSIPIGTVKSRIHEAPDSAENHLESRGREAYRGGHRHLKA